jgi:Carboxypeptidase regulatory-like domain
MRSIGPRLPILALIFLISNGASARAAEVFYIPTADWIPTASVVTVPTTYIAASSYVVPTSTILPTYYATAYVTDTALASPTTYYVSTYYETRLRRRGLFGRRLVETSRAYYIPTTAYYPTTYYYPTVFSAAPIVDSGVVATEYAMSSPSICCGEMVASAAPASSSVVRTFTPETSRPSSSAAPRTGQRLREPLQSEPAYDQPLSSNVDPELPASESTTTGAQDSRARPAGEAARGAEGQTQTGGTPTPPLPQRPAENAQTTPDQTKTAAPAQSKTGAADTAGQTRTTRPAPAPATRPNETPPVVPADGGLEPAPPGDAGSGNQSRTVKRPVLTPRTLRSDYRNVLFGRVKTRDTNEPEEGVRITLSNRGGAFEDKATMSDAFGRFTVRVPDGDWTVKVTMPSGRVYSVSQITVSNGYITDNIGRDIPSLVITR